MNIKSIPSNTKLSNSGDVTKPWRLWFQSVSEILGHRPFPLTSYIVSSVPDATAYAGNIIYVLDESGGAIIAFSDGVNWRRSTARAIIS